MRNVSIGVLESASDAAHTTLVLKKCERWLSCEAIFYEGLLISAPQSDVRKPVGKPQNGEYLGNLTALRKVWIMLGSVERWPSG
jgi:hypothetical protein